MMKTSRAATLRQTTALSAFAGPAPAENPTTPAEIAAAIQKAVNDFQAKNDERLVQLEKGREDAVTKDEVEKINGEITRLTNALDVATRDLGRLKVGGASAAGDDEVKAAAHFYTQARGKRVRPDAGVVDLGAYRAYKEAFEALVRANANGDMLTPDFKAAMSVGSDKDGGYLVPAEMSMEIEKRVYETSPMRQYARVITIGSDAWEAPYKASQQTSGGWVGEKQARTATATGTVGMQRIEAHEQYAYPEVTQKMLDDAMMDIEGFLVDDVEDVMSRTENTAFVSGTGVQQPRGFLNYKDAAVTTADATRSWGVLQYVASGAAGAFPKFSGTQADDPGALIDIMSALNPVYRPGAVWAMSRSTEAAIRKLRDADGRYLVEFGRLGDGAFGFQLHGHSIANFEDMPAIGSDTFSLAFGNFRRGYYIIDRIGYRLLRDPYTNKPYVGFYITKRTGGDVRNFDAIKLMKFAAS